MVEIESKKMDSHTELRKKRESKHPSMEVQIPGLKQIFDHSYTLRKKCFWLFMILLCLGVCVYQLTTLIMYYFSYPIVVDINILRNDSIAFPGIILCPLEMYKNFPEKIRTSISAQNCHAYADEIYASDCTKNAIDKLWEENSLLYDQDFHIVTACASSSSDKTNINCIDGRMKYPMEYKYIKTMFGQCLSLSSKANILFKGPDTFISFKETVKRSNAYSRPSISINQNEIALDSSVITAERNLKDLFSFSFLLHSSEIFPIHDIPFTSEPVYDSYKTILRWSVKEFRYLNTAENPCIDEELYVTCRDKCNEERLQKILPCSLPIVQNITLSQCKNETEVSAAYTMALEFYQRMKLSDCNCKRKCTDVIYSFSSDLMFKSPDNLTRLDLHHPNNIHEIVTEKFAYTLANLLSDIAGSVGFYLGVCVLSLLELLESIWCKKNQ